MTWLGPLNAIALILGAGIGWFFALYVWRSRGVPGAATFAGLMVLMGAWSFFAAMISLSGDHPVARLWLNMMMMVVPFVPVGALATCAEYTGHADTIRSPRLWFLLAIPIITALLSLTSDVHDLFIYDTTFFQSGMQNIGFVQHTGVWYWVYSAYSWILILFAILMLAQRALNERFQPYRLQALLLVIGFLLPLAASMYSVLIAPERTFITPLASGLAIPLVFWALFRYQMFNLTPVARAQVFEDMSDAVIVLDAQNRVVDINPVASRLVNRPDMTLIGKPFLDLIPASGDLARHWQDEAQGNGEITMTVGDQRRYFNLRVSPITNRDETVGRLIVLRDMTEQRLAEQRIRDMDMEQERIQIIAGFVEGASHEFRTPLANIKTASYLIRRLDDAHKHTERVIQIDDQVGRISQLIDALLTMVRLDGHVDFHLGLADINAIMQALSESLSSDMATRHQYCKVDLAEGLPKIVGDQEYLFHAFHAMTYNAILYTPEEGTITLRTACEDDRVQVIIEDTGIGISAEHLPRIFDVFYREDEARSTSGIGVGLSIAKRIIEKHNGTIEVHSVPDEGSVFRVMLPCCENPEALVDSNEEDGNGPRDVSDDAEDGP